MKFFKYIGLTFVLAVLTACSTTNFVSSQTADDIEPITGSQVAIYSFLDIRVTEFGEDMLTEFESAFQNALSERSVESFYVNFSDSKVAKFSSFSTSVNRQAYQQIPIADVIEEYADREAEAGTDFRLVIIPSNMRVHEVGHYYDVKWLLLEAETDEIVWEGVLKGDRTIWWSTNENSDGRAQEFAQLAIDAMTAAGLFR